MEYKITGIDEKGRVGKKKNRGKRGVVCTESKMEKRMRCGCNET